MWVRFPPRSVTTRSCARARVALPVGVRMKRLGPILVIALLVAIIGVIVVVNHVNGRAPRNRPIDDLNRLVELRDLKASRGLTFEEAEEYSRREAWHNKHTLEVARQSMFGR